MTKKMTLLPLLLWLVQYATVCAQQSVIKPFETGEKLPDVELSLHTGDSVTPIHLSDFSGKVVLLDFWGLDCSMCIAGMPHLLDLQQRFGDRIKVILVCSDDEESVRHFWMKAQGHIPTRVIDAFSHLPCVMGDRQDLWKSFAIHDGVPEQVWIDGSGVLRHRTSAATTTPENVEAFLKGEKAHLDERYIPSEKVSMADPLSWTTRAINFNAEAYSLITGFIPNYAPIYSYYRKEDSLTRKIVELSLVNKSILELYQTAWREKYKQVIPPDEIVLDVKDRGKYVQPSGFNAEWFAWAEKNDYCYAKKIRDTSEDIYDQMLIDLDRYFGLRVTKEIRRVKCYALKRITGRPLSESRCHDSEWAVNLGATGESQYQFKAYSTHEVVDIMAGDTRQLLDPFAPILDETNYNGKIDLVFPYFHDTSLRGAALYQALNKALEPYGLTLVEEYRMRKMWVLHERGYEPPVAAVK
jgi:thiol-disulfide isomerase/thioredoxin